MSSSTSSSSGAAATLVAGRVGRAHGLDGSFRVVEPRPQLLWLGARVTVAGAEREIVRRAGTDAAPILRLDGVSGRDQLEPLRGQALLVPLVRDAVRSVDVAARVIDIDLAFLGEE